MSSNSGSVKPLSLFICYVSKDSAYLSELEVHLTALVRQGLVEPWSRKNLMAGAEARSETLHKLKTSDIILLMISSDAIGSDEFWHTELAIALERHQKQEAVAIPVLLRETYWENTQIAALQVLPRNGKSVNSWNDHDAAYTHIVAEIPKVVEVIQTKKREKLQYSSYLERSLGSKYIISPSLQKKLKIITQNFSLSQQEILGIENRVLSRNKQRHESLDQYGRFYRQNRLIENSEAILRPILVNKLAELGLPENAADVKKMEQAIEKEINQVKRTQPLANQEQYQQSVSPTKLFERLDRQLFKRVGIATGILLLLIMVFTMIRACSSKRTTTEIPSTTPPLPPSQSFSPDSTPPLPPDQTIPSPTVEDAKSVVQAYLDAKKVFYARNFSSDLSQQLMDNIFTENSSKKENVNDLIRKKQQNKEYTKYYDQDIEAVDNFLSDPGQGSIKLKIREVWAVCQVDTDKPINIDIEYPRQDTGWDQATIRFENGQWKLDEIKRIEQLNDNDEIYKVEFCSDLKL